MVFVLDKQQTPLMPYSEKLGVLQGIIRQRADGYAYNLIATTKKKGCESKGRAAHGALSLFGLNAEVPRAQ